MVQDLAKISAVPQFWGKMMKMKRITLLAALLVVLPGIFAANSRPANAPGAAGGDDEESIRFQELINKWDQESAGLKARHKPERGHHDKSLALEFLRKYPKGEYSARAYLLVLEDGFCSTWANYPDCGAIEITGYEKFLDSYPDSRLKEGVELKMAQDYFSMAWLWLHGDGEHSDKWSNLFRAQSLDMAKNLKKSQDPQIQEAASELEQKLLKKFPLPIAPVPPQVLRPDYY